MNTVDCTLGLYIGGAGEWRADWLWGLLLIFLTVITHVIGLGLMHKKAVKVFFTVGNLRYSGAGFVLVIGAVTMLSTLLHMIEIVFWAVSYRILDAAHDFGSSMLYSLNAMTSYGHNNLFLNPHWQLLGACESLNGWLLFGLTTAFLFGMFQRALKSAEG